MHVGVVCELQEQPSPGAVADADWSAEFAAADEIEHLAATLAGLGHDVTVIGDLVALVRFLGCGGSVDLVFNYAAGVWGRAREAQVPALLEGLNVPYTGADAFTLTICIDKAIIKRLWHDAGLPTPPFRLVQEVSDLADVAEALDGFPFFVKPAREGSSKGISSRSLVYHERELSEQASALLARYGAVLVEPYLPGREFSVGVMGSRAQVEVLDVVEIVHSATPLVDVSSKKAWNPQTFQLVADRALRSQLCDLGLRAYQAVDCRSIGRVDMRMDRMGDPQLLEINPNPGLHPTRSAMPAMAGLAGLSYADLIARIVDLAAARAEVGDGI